MNKVIYDLIHSIFNSFKFKYSTVRCDDVSGADVYYRRLSFIDGGISREKWWDNADQIISRE